MSGGRAINATGYDVIVVGARVCGAATAMLLARAGLRVLAVDQARLPSDAVSSHQIQVPGAVLLRRWGLLGDLLAAGTPAASRISFDLDGVEVSGSFPALDGVAAVYSPRRYLLDDVLVRAARAAGAEVRDRCKVEELIWSGGRVAGVRCRAGAGRPVTERARLVIGADGKHSAVAAGAGAGRYRDLGPVTFASYGYWAGTGLGGGARVITRPGLAVAVFPTNDDLMVVFQAHPRGAFGAFRADPPAGFLAAADQCGDLGQRLREGRQAERLRIAPDLPHALTAASGPGWALAGDAGAVLDPITARSITHALQDADRTAAAVLDGLDGSAGLDLTLAAAWRQRDRELRPVLDGTARLARLRGLTAAERAVLAATADRPEAAAAFIAAFTGTRPWPEAMSRAGAIRRLGLRGTAAAGIALARLATRSSRDRHVPPAVGAGQAPVLPAHRAPPGSATARDLAGSSGARRRIGGGGTG